jgi:hypothetical protein
MTQDDLIADLLDATVDLQDGLREAEPHEVALWLPLLQQVIAQWQQVSDTLDSDELYCLANAFQYGDQPPTLAELLRQLRES